MGVKLHILGSGSAKPTKTTTPSGQILDMCNKQFLIDCGEGTQINMIQMGVRTPRLNNIFISHLHGDHCFGLIGLISTWAMLGRTCGLTIHAHRDLEEMLQPWLNYFCVGLPFDITFNHINPSKHEVIYEDHSIIVKTIPLKHKIPCCGFLFEEKPKLPHFRKELIEVYNIPLKMIPLIKEGVDFITDDGRVIPSSHLTYPAEQPFKYAYCSDTIYSEKIIPFIEGVNCLYHEATYIEQFSSKAKENGHSTARQAATIALKANVGRLLIGHFSSRITDFSIPQQEASDIFENTTAVQDRTTYILKK